MKKIKGEISFCQADKFNVENVHYTIKYGINNTGGGGTKIRICSTVNVIFAGLIFTCPKCAYKISQIFLRVFEFALAAFCAKFTKINAPQIFPLLQYGMWNLFAISGQQCLSSVMNTGTESMAMCVKVGQADLLTFVMASIGFDF